ncbi:TIGR01777 family protein [Aggregicoccus sp. 17bor-14]|uniref:TIGR01777 family oxidoreductase n=1 Tax=Myxococcaceae TaxID=31 RepID=UPI00129C781B|nr:MULTISPECIES: TIGR01777 family oxidoreductase [Myxococcaceae]MBF5042992.1 TIGR01777 family protein [Simulacricoccus sp. 17bor-14]MRI88757.1 TIGR01777 family protein [Aggregicoccus sp. 17bor-14]
MRVALTGASGFLGPELVRALLERGHAVHVLARDVPRALSRLPAGVTGARFDALQGAEVGALQGVDAVVHLAGEPVSQRWTREVRQRIYDSRAVGTRAVVAAMAEAKVKGPLVSASAVGYYGDRGAEPLTEASAPGRGFLADVCRAWEGEALKARVWGVRVACVRIGLVLHPEGGVLHKVLPTFKVGAGGRLGSGQQFFPWIHRADALGLLLLALERPEVEGALNAVAPEQVTNAQFTHVLGEVLHRPSVMHVPAFALKLAFGEMASAALEGQRVVPERALALGYAFQFPHLRDALEELVGHHREAAHTGS